jgi:hypothetical protein
VPASTDGYGDALVSRCYARLAISAVVPGPGRADVAWWLRKIVGTCPATVVSPGTVGSRAAMQAYVGECSIMTGIDRFLCGERIN